MSNPIPFLALPVCPTSTAVEEFSSHFALQNFQDMPGATSCSGMTSVTEVQNPPTHHNTLSETSPFRVPALSRDTVCSSTTNSCPSTTATTNILTGGISSTLPPPATTSSFHYHAVVCSSATCLGDRVITTPGPILQHATQNTISLSPLSKKLLPLVQTAVRPQQCHQVPREPIQPPFAHLASREEPNTAPRPQQRHQEPREHTQPPVAHLVSREELNLAIANALQNVEEMLRNLRAPIKEETATPQDAQHNYGTPRRNTTYRPSCQCGSPSSRERSPTPPSSPESFITTRLNQEKMLQNLIRASEVKFNGRDSQDYAPWKRALLKEIESLDLTANQELSLLEARTEDEANIVVKELRPLRNELGPEIALRTVWDTLDRTYYCPTSPTQTLLKKLTQGPDIRSQDATALLSLMLQCQSALALHRHNPIASLEDHTTMDAIVGRLDKVLRREWFTHLQTLPTHHAHMPTFKHFAAWIQQKNPDCPSG